MKQKLVKVGDFVTVLDGGMAKHGVKKGDTLYIAGDLTIPMDEGDPYAMRKIFIATYVIDGHIQAENARPFTIDGKRMTPVGKGKQAKYDAIKEADFGEPVES